MRAQVGKYLLHVNRRDPLDGFELDQQPAFDEKISPESLVDGYAVKRNGNGPLAFHDKATPRKALLKHCLVH